MIANRWELVNQVRNSGERLLPSLPPLSSVYNLDASVYQFLEALTVEDADAAYHVIANRGSLTPIAETSHTIDSKAQVNFELDGMCRSPELSHLSDRISSGADTSHPLMHEEPPSKRQHILRCAKSLPES